jgi:hypothetical protein
MDFVHHSGKLCATCALFLGIAACATEVPRYSDDPDWQLQLLMTPTPSQLVAEQSGRVFIYDSLEMGQVDDALDQNFDRIEHMMFIRIHHLPPTGAGPAEIEDDGCD